MIRSICLVVVALLLGAQEPADRVRDLVDKLDTEELAKRDAAQIALTRLGRTALPALKREWASSSGERRQRLERVIQRVFAFGTPPLVTLDVRNQTLADIVRELTRQSEVPIRVSEAAAGLRATFKCSDTPVWKALDDLCRASGGAMYRFEPGTVVLEPGKFRSLPAVDQDGFRFFIDRILLDSAPGSPFLMQCALLTPPGARVVRYQVELEELKDDLGAELAAMPEHWRGFLPGWNPCGLDSRRILFADVWRPPYGGHLSKEARVLTRCQGAVKVTLAGSERPIARCEDPLGAPRRPSPPGGVTLGVERWKRVDDCIVLHLNVGWEAESVKSLPWSLAPLTVFRLKDGGWHAPYSEYFAHVGPEAMKPRTVSVGFEWRSAVEAIELVVPESVVQVEIPFDFRDLPLR